VSVNASVSTGSPPDGVARRSVARFPILQRCFVRPAAPQDADAWRCIAYNISPTGVGIMMPFPPPRGTVLEIQPWGLSPARPVQVRVARTTCVEFLWFCGCELLRPLDPAELQTWLAQAQNWLHDASPAPSV
jgi:hypothetical protein